MKPCVLVIEDNLANAELVVYLLKSSGCRALTAFDGESGVAMACAERPDLVLCDLQLPGIDGFEVVRQLREVDALRGVPLVALTASAMTGDDDRILGRGFDGYISKPIDPTGFIALIRRHLPDGDRVGQTSVPPAVPAATVPRPRLATVLALDDTRINLELKRGLLEPHGYEVLTATTMDDALALARERLPQLILSDVGMAQGDGFEFITALKADPALRHIPVLFLSSTHWDTESRTRGLALGAVRYVRRPIDSDLLLREIRAVLAP
ncbi:response regulator [Ideonella sp. A 288]|uniref:response regulator n=1 Tax=Ideonella sp. A 288 TaxID=1962181 RepID=UPI001186BE87|nr:response regulator [Ideonella sp. A 288]